jgi:hypothetical protein
MEDRVIKTMSEEEIIEEGKKALSMLCNIRDSSEK